MMRYMLNRVFGKNAFSSSRWAVKAAAFVAMTLAPLSAFADEAKPPYDGRFNGYPGNRVLTLDVSSGLMWMLLVALGVVCLGVLFKNANRTHLD